MAATTPPAAEVDTAVPPVRPNDPVQWIRRNLFPNWWNSLLTILVTPLLLWAIFSFLRFVFVTARWEIIVVNLTNLVVGTFPRSELWRLWASAAILAVTIGTALGSAIAAGRAAAEASGRRQRASWRETAQRFGPPLLLLVTLAVFVRTVTPLLLLAGVIALGVVAYRLGTAVPASRRRWMLLVVILGAVASQVVISGFGGVARVNWGGLLLTLYFTVAALLLSFPIGVLVALGRRSSLPVVRVSCTVYVEFFRGAPLIVLLFAGWLVLGLFLPPQFPTPNIVTRALIIFVLFTSAYVAEVVRGGLQGIPRGQKEAAQALGLSPWKQTRLVVLPQALRSVIPGLVGQAISLFKDTTLILGIGGMTDLLGIANTITRQPGFVSQGYIVETLVFASALYWVGCYWMSRESQRLEARLGVGER